MMTKEGSTKIVNFMTHGAGVLVLGRGHISHVVKMHYFFQNLHLYSQAFVESSKELLCSSVCRRCHRRKLFTFSFSFIEQQDQFQKKTWHKASLGELTSG